VRHQLTCLERTTEACILRRRLGNGLAVAKHHKGYVVCAGDTALNPRAPVIGYGHSLLTGRSSA
jgi:hypothetical protein